MTTAITLAEAQAKLAVLKAASASETLSVRYADRMITYRTAQEIIEQINYWARVVTELQRTAMGASRHGYATADFSRRV